MAPYAKESTTTITKTIENNKQAKAISTLELSTCYKKYQVIKKTITDLINEHSSSYGMPLIWFNIISITIFHLVACIILILFPFIRCWRSIIWGLTVGGIGGFGITGGVHRFWCHRSFKANLLLRIILMLCYTVSGQNTIFDWVRDHRVHHKFSETNADPHNANRGFFFAHVGWLMMKKHPDVLKKGQIVDMSDVTSDPVVQFSTKYFTILKLVFCFFVPTVIPVYFWGEEWKWAIGVTIVRYVANLNFTWLVNSAAHLYGTKPYDRRISPVENLSVSILAMGEGWHNYHHTFPWDYKAAEHGDYKVNVTTFWLDVFSKLGWAWDLKQPTPELVRKVIARTGDGSHFKFGRDVVFEDGTFDIHHIDKSY